MTEMCEPDQSPEQRALFEAMAPGHQAQLRTVANALVTLLRDHDGPVYPVDAYLAAHDARNRDDEDERAIPPYPEYAALLRSVLELGFVDPGLRDRFDERAWPSLSKNQGVVPRSWARLRIGPEHLGIRTRPATESAVWRRRASHEDHVLADPDHPVHFVAPRLSGEVASEQDMIARIQESVLDVLYAPDTQRPSVSASRLYKQYAPALVDQAVNRLVAQGRVRVVVRANDIGIYPPRPTQSRTSAPRKRVSRST